MGKDRGAETTIQGWFWVTKFSLTIYTSSINSCIDLISEKQQNQQYKQEQCLVYVNNTVHIAQVQDSECKVNMFQGEDMC